jgi:rhodanese-related sulfurtransferase
VKSARELVADANERVDMISVQAAQKLLGSQDTVFVDLRDSAELAAEGKIPGAVHVNRGILEFAMDPTQATLHNPVFVSGKNFVFYCAGGGRSALAADTAIRMGLPEKQVCHLAGGFKAWKDAGAPVEQ